MIIRVSAFVGVCTQIRMMVIHSMKQTSHHDNKLAAYNLNVLARALLVGLADLLDHREHLLRGLSAVHLRLCEQNVQ